MEWSPQQDKALKDVTNWLSAKSTNNQVYRLFGFAGTGKTTLAKYFAEGVDGTVLFAAYTGKASLVMQSKGIPKARTIHSLVYRVRPANKKLENELDENRKEALKAGNKSEAARFELELIETTKPKFELNPESALNSASLLVIDECSMVDEKMGKDLESFKCPILVLGDPGQLPPPTGSTLGYFTEQTPHTMLTEIHRQAEGNPIIQLATLARTSQPIKIGTYGDSKKVRSKEFDNNELPLADQIITGKHVTREAINRIVRTLENMSDPIFPVKGDKLVCGRNALYKQILSDEEYYARETLVMKIGEENVSELARIKVTNGLMAKVFDTPIYNEFENSLVCMILREGYEFPCRVSMHACIFDKKTNIKSMKTYERSRHREFDFGYCITVHKSQGSQWDNLIVYDDGFGLWDKDTRAQWLYTALTRAVDKVTIVDRARD